jgi:predicted DNA-binding transcriptional regulator AlpA
MDVRIIRPKNIKTEAGISYSTALREETAGRFPKRRKLTNGCVGWLSNEVDEWKKNRMQVAA